MERMSRTNTSVVYFDGYGYKISITRNKRYYRCIENKRQSCRARGLMENNIIVLLTPHCHPRDTENKIHHQFKDALWSEVVTTEEELNIIYRRIALSHPQASRTITFSSIERSMNRWRQSVHPATPRTLLQYNLIVKRNEWLKYRQYSQGIVVIETIYIDRETSVTIFGDPVFLSTLADIRELYLDATFRDCPRTLNIKQLFTIMGCIDNSTVPLAWALMTRKTTQAYQAVLTYFRNQLAPNIIPLDIHQDFELALRNAVLIVYPDADIIHCYFHYCQAILKRIKRKGRRAMIRLMKWDIALAFYRKLLALPLLPANQIETAYRFLIQNTPPDVLVFFEDLIQYYPRTWLTHDRLLRLSVYRQTNRTNNPIEAYHRVLHTHFGIHPHIWKFTAKLKDLQGFTRIEIESLNRGVEIRRTTRQEYTNREHILNHMWNLLDNGTLSISRFLSCYNHVTPAYFNDMTVTTPAGLDQVRLSPSHNINIQPVLNGAIILQPIDVNEPIPVLRRTAEELNWQIFILNNVNDSLCTRCRQSILNVVCLPCYHWFLCQECTESLSQLAFDNAQVIFCRICNSQCIIFKTIQVS